jgi:conjugative transfer signal peptidase TraF
MTEPRPVTPPLPLFQWQAARTEIRARRRRYLRRYGTALGLLGLALATTIAVRPRPLLVWNASASAPLGLYGVGAPGDLAPGDMVIARVPSRWRSLAATRYYLPSNVPLVKRVAAAPGDTVCATGATIRVNGHAIALRQRADGQGRPLPWWHGCVLLRRGALLLLMADNPASFDGRYFGPSARGDLIGKAWPLWTR